MPRLAISHKLLQLFFFDFLYLLDPAQPLPLHGLYSLFVLLLRSLKQSPFLFKLLQNLLVGKLVLLYSSERLLHLSSGLCADSLVVQLLVLFEFVHDEGFVVLDLFDLHELLFFLAIESFFPADQLSVESFTFLLEPSHPDALLLDLLIFLL